MLARSLRASLVAVRRFSAEPSVAAVSIAKENPASSDTVNSKKTTGANGRDTLGKRLMSLVYKKRNAVIALNKWREEGHDIQKYGLNRIVRELRLLKRYKHALEVCEWMGMQKDFKLLPGDYAVHLDLIAKIRGINSAEKFFEDLPERMKDHTTCSALLHTYTQHKESEKAEALLAKMAECEFLKFPLPFNHMLNLYISTGQLEKVPGMIQELKKHTSPDVVTYNLWISVCALQNDVEQAEKVLLEQHKAKMEPDWMTYSTLTSLYIKNSLRKKAASTLGEMEKRVTKKARVAYSSLISLHTSLENKDEVNFIWKKMKSLYRKLNDNEYRCMIASLIKLDEFDKAKEMYTEWRSVSPTGDTRVPNLLVAAYINKNQMSKAEKFRKQMVQENISLSYTTWELFAWGYLKQKQVEKALSCFSNAIARVREWKPDEVLVEELFGALEESGDIKGAEELLVILRRAGYKSTEVYNSLLRTYAKAEKMPLLISERMDMDAVEMDDETRQLIKVTSKMCISEVPSTFA